MTQLTQQRLDDAVKSAAHLHGFGETSESIRTDLEQVLAMCLTNTDAHNTDAHNTDAHNTDAHNNHVNTARVHYALATHYMIRGKLDVAIQQCESGLGLVGGLQSQLEVDLLVLMSRQYLANNVLKARELTSNAMTLSTKINGHATASVLLRHAEAVGANGNVDEAIALLRQAESMFELDADPSGRLLALLRLCVQLINNRQFTLVIEYATEVLGLADELGRRMAKVNAFKFLAMALNGVGKPAEAYEVGKRALDLAEAHYPGHLVGDCSGILGDVYLQLKDLPTSLNYFARALSVYRQTGHRNGQALCLVRMGEVYGIAGQIEQAEHLLKEADEIVDAIGNAILKRSVALARAGLYMRQHNEEDKQNKDAIDKAVDMFRRIAGATSHQQLPMLDEIDVGFTPSIGDRSEVIGDRSEVIGDRSEVIGGRSEVIGDRSEVIGDRSEVIGDRSEVIGDR